MTETTNAEKLHITEGFVVWVIGRTVEETALLDPLPEGAEAVEARDEEGEDGDNTTENIDAAILFIESRAELVDDLDDVLPQLGSIPVVWISYPQGGRSEVDADMIDDLVADYGWHAVENISLDETWSAVRVRQS